MIDSRRMDSEIPSSIVFFDGVCNLCNGFVDFIVQRDHAHVLRFASLQGKTARERLGPGAGEKPASVVFYENGLVTTESSAVIRVLTRLGGAWRVIWLLKLIPSFVRDPIYRFIARNRYRWFGKRETCRLPSPEEKKLFLE
jgi:predicted DCC family thiol-disulfide oxidoreductase YuxK